MASHAKLGCSFLMLLLAPAAIIAIPLGLYILAIFAGSFILTIIGG